MPEIVRRMFLEGKDIVAEEQDWKSRELPPDVRGWSSYCIFLTDRDHRSAQAGTMNVCRPHLVRPTCALYSSSHSMVYRPATRDPAGNFVLWRP